MAGFLHKIFGVRDKNEMVRLVLSTNTRMHDAKEIANMCDQFDPTFIVRYDNDPVFKGRFLGEDFYDGDKYRIFYLTLPRNSIPDFVNDIKQHKSVIFVGETDGNYNLKQSQKPFFQSPQALDYRGEFGLYYVQFRDTRYPLCGAKEPEAHASVGQHPH